MTGDLPSIQQMECFIIYGRVQNFTRAAKEANITQSAFSAQMKNLESTLGVALIQRSKRGSHLTPEGEAFLKRITAWMDGLHKIVYDLQSTAATQSVELNVGILRTLGDIQVNRQSRTSARRTRTCTSTSSTLRLTRSRAPCRTTVSTSSRRTTSPTPCPMAGRQTSMRPRTSAGTILSTTRHSCSRRACRSRARKSSVIPSSSTRRTTS